MIEFLHTHNLLGLFIGFCTFLVIGFFHPLVIKGEYYFGIRIRWAFLVVGIICCVAAWLVSDIFWSTILGVTGFSAFWGIGEIIQQQKRVEKGWFPRNPKRRYPFDDKNRPKT